jgi:hypothetical protein
MRHYLGLAIIAGFSFTASLAFAADTKSTDQPSSDPDVQAQKDK